jgi:hypothetical protein
MTFLHYVAEVLLGPPDHQTGNEGESYWNACPACGTEKRKFHVRPHKPPHRDRWSCFRCGAWGDEIDLIRLIHPEMSPDQHVSYWHKLNDAFNTATPAEQLREPKPGGGEEGGEEAIHSSPGAGANGGYVDPRLIDCAWADLTEEERKTLVAARHIMSKVDRKVTFAALSDYCLRAQLWFEKFKPLEDRLGRKRC